MIERCHRRRHHGRPLSGAALGFCDRRPDLTEGPDEDFTRTPCADPGAARARHRLLARCRYQLGTQCAELLHGRRRVRRHPELIPGPREDPRVLQVARGPRRAHGGPRGAQLPGFCRRSRQGHLPLVPDALCGGRQAALAEQSADPDRLHDRSLRQGSRRQLAAGAPQVRRLVQGRTSRRRIPISTTRSSSPTRAIRTPVPGPPLQTRRFVARQPACVHRGDRRFDHSSSSPAAARRSSRRSRIWQARW